MSGRASLSSSRKRVLADGEKVGLADEQDDGDELDIRRSPEFAGLPAFAGRGQVGGSHRGACESVALFRECLDVADYAASLLGCARDRPHGFDQLRKGGGGAFVRMDARGYGCGLLVGVGL